jgi:hypothetical protein
MIQSLASGLLLSAVLFASFSMAAAASDQGTLEVRVKDHREAIGDFSTLVIKIDGIALKPKRGLKFWQNGWKRFASATESVDLTRYVGKESARVFRGPIDVGSFEGIDLKVREVEGILKTNRQRTTVKNLVGPVRSSFDVRPTGETLLVLDLVVFDMSDHPPRGYELGIRGYELYTNGKLIDKIPPGP